jgi:hypothetical protein
MSAGATIKLRRDTAAAWTAANPVLSPGEPGLETDTNLIKYGNGATAWNNLLYASVVPEAVTVSLLPVPGDPISLGSPDARWTELHLTGNSIYLGNVVLSESNGELAVNGSTVATTENTLSNRGADSINWNLITDIGLYTVNRTSWSGTIGTPLDSQVFVGTLEVLVSSTTTDTSVTQNFFPGQQMSNAAVQFTRSNWNGTWTYWQKIVNTSQIVSGGEF